MSSVPSLFAQLESGAVQRASLLPAKLPEEKKPRDWVKITAIAVLVIAGLVAAFAGLSISGMFPVEIFGCYDNALFIAFGAGIVAASAGGVFYYKWKVPKQTN